MMIFFKLRLKQKGFSLLELLIVLGLMATAAVLALSSVNNRDNQNRFEETRNKLQRMQKAIVGEAVFINGQLNVNGFVADMGRLPVNLNELMTAPEDCDGDSLPDGCPWQFDSDSEIWHGWHGPYISAIAHYRDGWGNQADTIGATSSSFDDAIENDGWYWDNSVSHTLLISSTGLDHNYVPDANGNDTANSFSATQEQAYGDSGLQRIAIYAQDNSVDLPYAPLHLSVASAPFCGQCRDDDPTHQSDVDCATAGHAWNTDLSYCVIDSTSTPVACDALSTDASWVPLYSHCSDPVYNNATDCVSSGASWRLVDNSTGNQCSDYHSKTGTSAHDFTDGNNDFCVRAVHVKHGAIVSNSYRSSNSSARDISTYSDAQSDNADDRFMPEPDMESDASTPVAGLTLPQGQMRIALFHYDSATNTCSTDPFPSASAQARSDVISLSSRYAPNIGTGSQPILLNWRSQ